VGIVLVLVLGYDFVSPLPVVENTNKNDVISAVVLGDTAKSKILPQNPPPEPVKQMVKEEPKPEPLPKPEEQQKIEQAKLEQARLEQEKLLEKEIIALKKAAKKKLAAQKALELKKQRDLFAKNLLDDIKKTTAKQKNSQTKKLASQFQKNLQLQAEKSLREQLLNEEIKLQGMQTRESQGEVNKYKALILQSISQHWIIPSQADKSLYCELMIRIAPGGMVLDVQVIRSSGDPSLDSSARAAVMKASPLPVPSDPNAFEPFRQFVLKVKPQNVVSGDGIIGTI
jgi:colicin import membrane protein